MSNDSLTLFKAWSKKFNAGVEVKPTPAVLTMCAILDHFNYLHFQDRDKLKSQLDFHRNNNLIHCKNPHDD